MELLKLVLKVIPGLVLSYGFRTHFVELAAIRFGKSYLTQGLAHATVFFYISFVWLWLSPLEATFGWRGASIGYAIVFYISFIILVILVPINEKQRMEYKFGRPGNETRSNPPTSPPLHFSSDSPSIPPLSNTSILPTPSTPSLSSSDPENQNSTQDALSCMSPPHLDQNLPFEPSYTFSPKIETIFDYYDNYCPPDYPPYSIIPDPKPKPVPSPSSLPVLVPSPVPTPVPKPEPATVAVHRTSYNFREMDLNWDEEVEELKKGEEEKNKKEVEEKVEKKNDSVALPYPLAYEFPTPSAPEQSETNIEDDIAALLDGIEGLRLVEDMEWKEVDTTPLNTNKDDLLNIPVPDASVYYEPSAPPLPPELAHLLSV